VLIVVLLHLNVLDVLKVDINLLNASVCLIIMMMVLILNVMHVKNSVILVRLMLKIVLNVKVVLLRDMKPLIVNVGKDIMKILIIIMNVKPVTINV